MQMYPPDVRIGKGGPPATPVAHDLRAMRERFVQERRALRRNETSAFSEIDRELRLVELGVQIKFLSEQILEAERANS